MFQRLLVPLDGSHLAEAVLPLVERLAAAFHSSVVLLYVLERSAPREVHGDRHLTEAPEANEYLQRIAGRLRAQNITVEYHVHDAPEGDVARSIALHADEEGVDLIVLCTHGSGRMRDLLFGSIAQQVLNGGTTPVLLVRPTVEGGAPPFEPRTVLVPLDATAAAEVALAPAHDMARALQACLHLVMVVATQDTLRGDRLASATLLPSATRAALELEEHHATTYLDALADRLRTDSLSVTTEVRRGNTASALVDEAAEPGVGLVALATHGRAGLQATWAGSVTAQLLSRTRAPVLLLRTIER
ncbi:MAG: universal stress protein [Chloroflexota bacterium]